jgi:xylan 1,4-beta-xylosidase
METSGLVQGYSFWTFSDIFSENYFPSIPFQGGFGLLNLYGIAKPVYRAFELLHHLGTESLVVQGSHATVDAWIIRKENAATVLLTNHAMPRHPIHTELVDIRLTRAPRPRIVYVERIDRDHANAHQLWQTMGEPKYLNALQVDQLNVASCLDKKPLPWTYDRQNISISIALPPHAVAAITIEFLK